MKRLLSSIIVAAFCVLSASAQGDEYQPYFTVEEQPDLIKCLPGPPAKGSATFKHDIQRYKWGKEQRKNPERAEMAKRDAVWTYEAMLAEFKDAFGMAVSKEATPCIWKVLARSISTVDPIRVAPKAHFRRIRPFVYFKEPTLTGEDDHLRGEGSYPSGHTMRSWLVSLLLAEINPAAADAIYARGWAYGESRVIAGAHWQSDVDVSRAAASIGYGRLQTSADFRADMELAQDEFRLLAKAHSYQTILLPAAGQARVVRTVRQPRHIFQFLGKIDIHTI